MNIFNQGKQEKPFIEIINWKNLDIYYGFLLIPSTSGNEGISEILRNNQQSFPIIIIYF